ncbi:growth-regulating factor 10-like [Nymphaea colorata]|nr:growth-regulating factor 10-like [Nymphaea colorata]
MEAPHTHREQQHHHHQPWKSDAHGEDQTFLLATKVPRLASPRDAVRPSPGMASPVGLGLGLGLGLGSAQSSFTFMQLQELEHQALIFKYMAAGVPVPLHLVLPIWKSVVSSPMGMVQPSSMSGGGLCFDFRNGMEPEPGRCRRTDGKKWRCSKEVVPDHKYCEKHMHRGRNRSRKPVERQTVPEPSKSTTTTTTATTTTVAAAAVANPTTTNSSTITTVASGIPDSSTQLSISISDGLSLVSNHKQVAGNTSASVSSSPRLEFSPTSVLHKVYYGGCISETSSGSTSRTESNFGELV